MLLYCYFQAGKKSLFMLYSYKRTNYGGYFMIKILIVDDDVILLDDIKVISYNKTIASLLQAIPWKL